MKTFRDYGIDVPSSASGEWQTTCPECSSQRRKKRAKCLSVNVEKGAWCCHHCGWTGGLGDGGHTPLNVHWQRPQFRKPEPIIATPSDGAIAYMAKRGIPKDVLERNGIVTASVYMPQVEDHVNAIAFPYWRGAEIVNHKYRDHDKNFRMDAGAEPILYGLNDLAETTVIVEGEIDKLSVETAGMLNCVSVPHGAPPPDSRDYTSKFDFLNADAERLAEVKTWIIAVDNDPPGQRLEDELARRLGRENCRRVTWPDGCKDANDVLQKHGASTLARCLVESRPYPIKGVFDVMDVSDRVFQLWERGWEKGLSTGWPSVDEYYTVRAGEFTVVTGIPNSGKSNWLDALCVNLSKKHGWRFAVFSPENQPIEDHIARYLEKSSRMPFGAGAHERMSRDQADAAMRWVNEHFHWILPDDDADWTIDAVLDAARALVRRHGIQGLVIDPWNELEHSRPRELSETEYISHALKRIRQFGRKNGVHVWIVAHPAKLYRDKDGNYPVPTMYDISSSAHWRNKADNGICIWRNFAEGACDVDVHVQKVRFRQIGCVGAATLRYNRIIGTYHDQAYGAVEPPLGTAA
jgi:twinkle protein